MREATTNDDSKQFWRSTSGIEVCCLLSHPSIPVAPPTILRHVAPSRSAVHPINPVEDAIPQSFAYGHSKSFFRDRATLWVFVHRHSISPKIRIVIPFHCCLERVTKRAPLSSAPLLNNVKISPSPSQAPVNTASCLPSYRSVVCLK